MLNPFRAEIESSESLATYRRFLSGDILVAGDYVFSDLAIRIRQMQTELPLWMSQNPQRQHEMERLLDHLNQLLESNHLAEASRLVDEILSQLHP